MHRRSKCHVGRGLDVRFCHFHHALLTGWKLIYLGAFIGAWFYFIFGEKIAPRKHTLLAPSTAGFCLCRPLAVVLSAFSSLGSQPHGSDSYFITKTLVILGLVLGPQEALAKGQGCIFYFRRTSAIGRSLRRVSTPSPRAKPRLCASSTTIPKFANSSKSTWAMSIRSKSTP